MGLSRRAGILITIAFLALSPSAAFSTPMDGADPSLPGPGGDFLTIMPRDRFAVDHRLRKNVDFWIQIYSKYTTQQGLIHDSKYVDKVYEVLDLSHGEHGVRPAKKKWREVLLSLHRKRK